MMVIPMNRLTESALPLPENSFKKCQLCGRESSDVVDFRFWRECDENDKVEPYSILVTCRSQECYDKIDAADRLYIELPWSQGRPGHFILLCGECSYRDGFRCTHPDLKDNGGEGLLLGMANDAASKAIANVCYHTRDGYGLRCGHRKPPMVRCSGLPEDHERFMQEK